MINLIIHKKTFSDERKTKLDNLLCKLEQSDKHSVMKKILNVMDRRYFIIYHKLCIFLHFSRNTGFFLEKHDDEKLF